MDYYESAEGYTISKERAKKEIAKHGIKISTGETVGSDCFDKQMTKPRVSGKKEYRFGAAHIIHIAKVVEYKTPAQWELYNVSQSATKFEAI